MSAKSKYYEIFGLTDKATKSEVKRAYRKLAMKFHPDRNPDPKAHKLFLDLTEAYQILLDDKPIPQPVLNAASQTRAEKTEEERIREAQERLKQQNNRIKFQQEYFFRKMTSGKRWKIFKITVFLSTLLALILWIEPILPSHFEKHTVVAFSRPYNGLQERDIQYFKTDQGVTMFVASPNPDIFHVNPEIIVERSFLMRNPIRVWYKTIHTTQSFPLDFSIHSLFPLIPTFLLLPAYTLWYKRRNYNFVMLYYISQYLVGSFALYVLITQERWLHILTFGIY